MPGVRCLRARQTLYHRSSPRTREVSCRSHDLALSCLPCEDPSDARRGADHASSSVGAMERATSTGARANCFELLSGSPTCEGRGSIRCKVTWLWWQRDVQTMSNRNDGVEGPHLPRQAKVSMSTLQAAQGEEAQEKQDRRLRLPDGRSDGPVIPYVRSCPSSNVRITSSSCAKRRYLKCPGEPRRTRIPREKLVLP